MISADEALKIIKERIQPLQSVTISLPRALGKTLAENIISNDNVPPFDNSAMDGYAVRAREIAAAPVLLKIVGEIAAGTIFSGNLDTNQAVAIMTGSKIPVSCDTVVPQEMTERCGDDKVKILNSLPVGTNVRKAGKDIQKSEKVFGKGQLLRSPEIGVLASLGHKFVNVRQTPTVSVLATGNELVELDKQLTDGQIRNSNAYSLCSIIRESGCEAFNIGIARDNPEDLRNKLRKGLDADMLLTTGGVSVGKYDLVQEELKALGVDIHFWKVNIKPGMPLLFGTWNGKAIFGLPGNPVSALVTFSHFVRPALFAMMGRNDSPMRFQAQILHDINKNDRKRHFMRGILEDINGVLSVKSTGMQDSNILTSLTRANCLIIIPEEKDVVKAGEQVEVELL
ncbi:MAG: gephyrin-like molybdotransferase Glp [Bacteroidota bacterium]